MRAGLPACLPEWLVVFQPPSVYLPRWLAGRPADGLPGNRLPFWACLLNDKFYQDDLELPLIPTACDG